jgi:uncharacterized damage-inducible protein DinB
MSIATDLLAEFETQSVVTRRYLERVPEDRLTWKPHDRSMTAGQLALHLALTPGGIVRFVQASSQQVPDFAGFQQPATRAEILQAFDESIASVRDLLPKFDDAAMNEAWRLMSGDKVLAEIKRQQFVRDIMFSHCYQHRGQLGVYLRLLDVPVPAAWGPSADEVPVFLQTTKAAA